MTSPSPPTAPAQFALTSVYTNPYLAGTDGPSVLTTDPVVAAQFFLDTDRTGDLEVMAHTTGPDGAMAPVLAGTVVETALAALPASDPRRDMLRTAQVDWLEDRLWDRQDEPYGLGATGPDWTRGGAAWGAEFTAPPDSGVLAALAARHPGAEEPHVPLVTAALRVAGAIRQSRGPAGSLDREQLAAMWRLLDSSWPAREHPAVRAAAARCLRRLADLDPLTTSPPTHLTGQQLARWRAAADGLQRDLVVMHPALHPGRIEAFTSAAAAPDPFLDTAAPGPAPRPPDAARGRPEAALAAALELLSVRGPALQNVSAAARGVLGEPTALPLPAQPGTDADAALQWRARVPSARRAGEENDAILTSAYTYIARAARETELGTHHPSEQGGTGIARQMAEETTGRHAVLGRLLALAEAERAATAHEPRLHEDARATAGAARAEAERRGLLPLEVHFAEQAAYTAAYDSARALLDDALDAQRRTVRTTIAHHYPRPDHRLYDQLAGAIDNQAIGRADNAARALRRALEDLLARERNPNEAAPPTAEEIAQARRSAEAAERRYDEVVRLERPAVLAALKALTPVLALPATPPHQAEDEATARLDGHRRRLAEQLTERTVTPTAAPTAAPHRAVSGAAQRAATRPGPAARTNRGVR